MQNWPLFNLMRTVCLGHMGVYFMVMHPVEFVKFLSLPFCFLLPLPMSSCRLYNVLLIRNYKYKPSMDPTFRKESLMTLLFWATGNFFLNLFNFSLSFYLSHSSSKPLHPKPKPLLTGRQQHSGHRFTTELISSVLLLGLIRVFYIIP